MTAEEYRALLDTDFSGLAIMNWLIRILQIDIHAIWI